MLKPKLEQLKEDPIEMRKLGGKWLKQRREEAGLSQEFVATKLTKKDGKERTDAWISLIEGGGPNFPENSWPKYSQILSIDETEFVKKMLMYYKPVIFKMIYGSPNKKELYHGIKR